MSVIGLGLGACSNMFARVDSTSVGDTSRSGNMEITKSGSSVANAETNAVTAHTDSVVVTLSESAIRASVQSAEQSFKDVGMAARAKLDALILQAAKKTSIHTSEVNIQRDTEISDYASFSDQELAAINLNISGDFSEDEQVRANALLAERLRVSLEPYRNSVVVGDRRGQAMAINALYDKMTPEVRRALGWTPAMMVSNNGMLHRDEQIGGKLDNNAIIANLRSAQYHGGLTFDKQPSGVDLSIYSLSISITTTTGLFGK